MNQGKTSIFEWVKWSKVLRLIWRDDCLKVFNNTSCLVTKSVCIRVTAKPLEVLQTFSSIPQRTKLLVQVQVFQFPTFVSSGSFESKTDNYRLRERRNGVRKLCHLSFKLNLHLFISRNVFHIFSPFHIFSSWLNIIFIFSKENLPTNCVIRSFFNIFYSRTTLHTNHRNQSFFLFSIFLHLFLSFQLTQVEAKFSSLLISCLHLLDFPSLLKIVSWRNSDLSWPHTDLLK